LSFGVKLSVRSKDHSTVISAVKKIDGLLAQDANLRSVVTTLEAIYVSADVNPATA
jgi:chromosomal replication initiation ATPase DnaA